MGFHELQNFNDVILAKQVWRLLTNEDSLFHKFFKAMFFLKGGILEAKEGYGSFVCYGSFLKGREVVQKGMLWRVGNTSSIWIYQDNWLPGPSLKKVRSPPTFFGSNAKVSSLIDAGSQCWIQEVIDTNFLLHEASITKSIPLSFGEWEDLIIWHLHSEGDYSVKSRYRLLLEHDLNE